MNLYYPKIFTRNITDVPTLVSNQGVPIESVLKDTPEKPGWWAQTAHELAKMNTLIQAGEFGYNQLNDSPSTDHVPEDWTAMQPDSVEGFPDKYFGYLVESKSPNDLIARQQKVREQMEEDERFANGSLSASLIGGFAGRCNRPFNLSLANGFGLS